MRPVGGIVRMFTGVEVLRMRLSQLTLLFLIGAGAAFGQPSTPYRAPYVPANDAVVLQRVPSASDPAVRQMESLRSRLTVDRGNVRLADELARAYIEYGRRVGDAHFAGYAEAVIAPWLAAADPPTALLVTQATLLQYRHEFAKARALLDRAVARDPKLAQAWLSLATLDMVQGDYAGAAAHCSQVSRHGGLALGLACTGNLRLYTGEAEQGMALLARIDGGRSPAMRAWVEGLLAEGAERLGRFDRSESHYREALGLAPGDNFLLVAYADFLLDRGRPKDVLGLLADYAESDTAFLRLALAHAGLGTAEAARYRWVMTARFEAYRQRGSELFGREEARFLLHLAHEPDAALAAALRNFELQREPADVRVALQAALAARRPDAASQVISFVVRSKLSDPQIDALVRALQGGTS